MVRFFVCPISGNHRIRTAATPAQPSSLLPSEWDQWVGIAGATAILIAYLLLWLGKLSPSGLPYPIINAVGAALVVVSLVFNFNVAALFIEAFWILISAIGIVQYIRAKSPPNVA